MEKNCPVIDVAETGRRIKYVMEARGFTVKDVQKYLKLSTPQSIYHWFDGRNLPSIDNFYALSELFHMPLDLLICGNKSDSFGWRTHRKKERLLEYTLLINDLNKTQIS